jgi:prolipoprotein diacylglyceryltransferase
MWIQGALRHDLGLYELVFTLLLFTAITLAVRSRKCFDGFVIAVTASSYAVVRLGLDVLRVGEATYAGLTLAQWGCLPLFALGLYTLLSGWSLGGRGIRSAGSRKTWTRLVFGPCADGSDLPRY